MFGDGDGGGHQDSVDLAVGRLVGSWGRALGNVCGIVV